MKKSGPLGLVESEKDASDWSRSEAESEMDSVADAVTEALAKTCPFTALSPHFSQDGFIYW